MSSLPHASTDSYPTNHSLTKKAIVAKLKHSEPMWQQASRGQPFIEPNLRHWLLDKNSLTEKLVAKSDHRLRVEVLQQRIQNVRLSERRALDIKAGRWAVVREVILYGNNIPWVYARTVIPLNTLRGSLRRLHYLGNKPLGRQLFTHPNMQREAMEVAAFFQHHLPTGLAINFHQNHSFNSKIWGRRSVFRLSNKPLLVCEIFLPDLLK